MTRLSDPAWRQTEREDPFDHDDLEDVVPQVATEEWREGGWGSYRLRCRTAEEVLAWTAAAIERERARDLETLHRFVFRSRPDGLVVERRA